MRVLWITYAPLGRAGEVIEGMQSQSGTWIDATAKELQKRSDVKLGIACIASKNVKIHDDKTGVIYYGLSEVKRVAGSKPNSSDVSRWKTTIHDFNPDLIMIWGTEYANGLSVIDAAESIPVLFFIQGVVGRIVQYPLGGLSSREIVREVGLVHAFKFMHYKRNSQRLQKQRNIEIQMVRASRGIITDNQWADSYYKALVPNVNIYHLPLPINENFLQSKYDLSKAERHTIFTIDGCNPAKGVFHLINALAIVKRIYPNVKLLIPGRVPSGKPKLIYESPYYTYLRKLIKRSGLEKNVVFLGRQSSEQMKEHLLSCHVFVMPSVIENHSSSLREAMYLGVPCVSSLVGSVDEFTQYEGNALTYRYEEDESLAISIIQLFDDDELAEHIGERGYHTIRDKFPQNNIDSILMDLYNEVINK